MVKLNTGRHQQPAAKVQMYAMQKRETLMVNSVQKTPILMAVPSPVLMIRFCAQPSQIPLDVKLRQNATLKRRITRITLAQRPRFVQPFASQTKFRVKEELTRMVVEGRTCVFLKNEISMAICVQYIALEFAQTKKYYVMDTETRMDV